METSLSQTDISLVQLPIRVIFNIDFPSILWLIRTIQTLKVLPVASLIINKGKTSYDDINYKL